VTRAALPDRAAAAHVDSHLATEFGQVMAALVATVPGARGAVLTDRDGHAIDFALDAGAIDELDLQIAGAQCARTLAAMQALAQRRALGRTAVLLEATAGCLLGATLRDGDELTVVLVLRARAHLGLALVAFDRACNELAQLVA
jgi:predicted regulator of Ras-like GTPase activity (Roadblock/LC7/MglB family)